MLLTMKIFALMLRRPILGRTSILLKFLLQQSSLLQTSSEDVNIVEDASIEPAKDDAEPTKDDPKSGENAPSDLLQ